MPVPVKRLPIDMNEKDDLFPLLDDLVGRWCERRALNPLRHILPVYPLSTGLSDEWHKLDETLKDIRALCKDELGAEEKEKLNQVILLVQNVLNR
ncbi:MAG TPA: hypothetical protein VJU86_06400 [Pyrinomonadaceae bacterium]|nr:hypothetical protein [Pyrinomonadaceae bacterium]